MSFYFVTSLQKNKVKFFGGSTDRDAEVLDEAFNTMGAVVMDGANVAQQYIKAGLFDEMQVRRRKVKN